MRNYRTACAILALLALTALSGCLKQTLPDAQVILPPAALLEDCREPEESGQVLLLLKAQRTDDAAAEYVRYVLDVRDSFQLCNGRLKEARDYCDNMRKALEGGDK